ncbi:hypothetical protein WISP_21860 [Willisornis vidua]|uniref:Uncharacterized protein n=1 Tax=Willisornis vidua TaxID=1566151 RepID=A0ABQ9DN16_9PASS|nr:hypothetical protein WISP_21860 [Willisornis vidua]
MKFNKVKQRILHLGWGTSGHMYREENGRLENSSVERALGVLVHDRLNSGREWWSPPIEVLVLLWIQRVVLQVPNPPRGENTENILYTQKAHCTTNIDTKFRYISRVLCEIRGVLMRNFWGVIESTQGAFLA